MSKQSEDLFWYVYNFAFVLVGWYQHKGTYTWLFNFFIVLQACLQFRYLEIWCVFKIILKHNNVRCDSNIFHTKHMNRWEHIIIYNEWYRLIFIVLDLPLARILSSSSCSLLSETVPQFTQIVWWSFRHSCQIFHRKWLRQVYGSVMIL